MEEIEPLLGKGKYQIYYTVNQGKDFFCSVRAPLQAQVEWKEADFLLTLESGLEILRFQIYAVKYVFWFCCGVRAFISALDEEILLDSFDLLLEEKLEGLKDQAMHQEQLSTDKHSYLLKMRWRYDEVATRISNFKKKLEKLEEVRKKEEHHFVHAKRHFEHFNSKTGIDLLREWGIFKLTEEDVEHAIAFDFGREERSSAIGGSAVGGFVRQSKTGESFAKTIGGGGRRATVKNPFSAAKDANAQKANFRPRGTFVAPVVGKEDFSAPEGRVKRGSEKESPAKSRVSGPFKGQGEEEKLSSSPFKQGAHASPEQPIQAHP